ncbi:glyoxal oxidase N-terminus-domain-containing protein [Roridomyces roridus]|uniref:Glyoxal oxidase N-terminus-domain-containing protein n=1 Tax=Roridomyces roridus TaxID=1738132 RepID=A0AAD7BHM4_9AGAR|nr:glyoxal oxidase N-terminus-domain-containing protein [Roridomyces roridus]
MPSLNKLSLLSATLLGAALVGGTPGWKFSTKGHSGILALEAIVVSPTLVLMFDRATDDPLHTPDGNVAWGALWNLETNEPTAVKLQSDSFCASGSILSNGTMVSVGGNDPATEDLWLTNATNGLNALRLFGPCTDPAGVNCTIFEDINNVHLAENRWYPTTIRISDGSLMIMGGNHEATTFYNTAPSNTYEFFPSKDGGVPRHSPLLARTVNTIIYDIDTDTETLLPDLCVSPSVDAETIDSQAYSPNGQRVSNPFDGTAQLLPLYPPAYTPTILACGGSNKSDLTPTSELSSQDPALAQCSRITLTPEGIEQGWELDSMPQGRMMAEMIPLPNGQILIINGGQTGYAAYSSDGFLPGTEVGNSNADHPAFTPILYTPWAPLGSRMSQEGLPATDIPRLYHSTVTLTPQGNLWLAGSNPNANTTVFPPGVPGYSTEFRVETLDPPYMELPRPILSDVPQKIAFNENFTIGIDIPEGVSTSSIQVALVDLGFSTHAFHSSARVVFMNSNLSNDGKELTITAPPNNRVYPPGPGMFHLASESSNVL